MKLLWNKNAQVTSFKFDAWNHLDLAGNDGGPTSSCCCLCLPVFAAASAAAARKWRRGRSRDEQLVQTKAVDGAASGDGRSRRRKAEKKGRKRVKEKRKNVLEKKEGRGGHVPLTWPALYLAKNPFWSPRFSWLQSLFFL